jgi:hypothetical protein
MTLTKFLAAHFSVVVLSALACPTWAAAAPFRPASADSTAGSVLGTAGTLTQDGITWTFDKPVQYGKFVTGDYWVLGPPSNRNPKTQWAIGDRKSAPLLLAISPAARYTCINEFRELEPCRPLATTSTA